MSHVTFIFPPVVETSFGRYYPSIAVLSAHAKAIGATTTQIDLNEGFAEHLLKLESLRLHAAGDFGPWGTLDPASPPAISARLLSQHRDRLFDSEGRHKFREDADSRAHLLHELAKPFRFDEELPEMLSLPIDDGRITYWQDFASSALASHQQDLLESSIVGFSIAMGPQLFPAICIAHEIRRLAPLAKIVFGGAAISLLDNRSVQGLLMRSGSIDLVVQFEGENVLKSILRQVSVPEWRPEDFPGTSFRSGDEVRRIAPAPAIKLPEAPFADYDSRLLDRSATREISVVLSRGCYWGKCAYCDFIELYKGNRRVRFQIPSRFVDEIEHQIRLHGVNEIEVVTEAIPPVFAKRISAEILERGLRISWSSFAMVDPKFDSSVFAVMARSGCRTLVVGVETFVDRILSFVRKRADSAMSVAFIVQAADAGIHVSVNLIPNLPSTTYDEAMAALEIARSIQSSLGGVSVFPFEATLSSAVGRNPEQFGLVKGGPSKDGQAQFANNKLDWSDPAMSSQELAAVLAAYEEFARDINKPMKTDDIISDLTDDAYKVDLSQVDIIPAGKRWQLYNPENRSKFYLSGQWVKTIHQLAQRTSFTRSELCVSVDVPTQADMMLNRLSELGVLARTSSTEPHSIIR